MNKSSGTGLYSLGAGGILFALLFYLPPPGPLALLLYHFPIPLTWVGKDISFLISSLLIFFFFSAFIFLLFVYGKELFGEDIFEKVQKILDRTALGIFDNFATVLSLAALIILPFFSFHYLPFGLALFLAFLAVRRAPTVSREMGATPKPLPAAPASIERSVRQTYAWSFDCDLGENQPVRKAQFLALVLDLDKYDMLKGKNPSRERSPNPGDFVELVGSGIGPEVEKVAEYIRATTRDETLCSFLEIINTMSFVQNPTTFPYKTDLESTGIAEYWRYPLETLVDREGDCECKAILAAAILRVLGFDCLFLLYPPQEGKAGHMALAIKGGDSFPPGLKFFPYKGEKYFYCELTEEGMHPGEIPSELREIEPEVYRLPEAKQ